jgi:MoaA/NifB/PqqE/SkfB family radical SAM enzyme
MKLSGLHILLTYQCNYECDHCFVWGSPRQAGTLTLEQIEEILNQAKDAGVTSIYFEGGEPFLYYAVLNKAVHMAADMGFPLALSRTRTGRTPWRMLPNGFVRSRGG